MPRIQEFQLHPSGWENDPEEERFPLSVIDYLTTQTYLPMTLFFKLEEADKLWVPAILKIGIEKTLSQIRHFCGTVERDDDIHHSIVKKKSSTVKFVIQYLDSAEDKFPSFSEIEEAHFVSTILGDVNVLCNAPMTFGVKPEAHPDNRPAMSSFKATFIPGGLIFIIHAHHYSIGIRGFNAMAEQLAGNCRAVAHATQSPPFDTRLLDRSFLNKLKYHQPSHSKDLPTVVPPRPGANLGYRPSRSLMFHLRESRAADLKKAASPSDGSRISTYDAICAIIWRVLSRIREPLYKPGLDYKPLWVEGVTLHKLFTNPTVPDGIQGNIQVDVKSTTSSIPQLTLAEIISEAPLSKLAGYNRRLTSSVTADFVAGILQEYENVRNKHELSINLAAFPPMAILVSDWRPATLCTYNFGFGEPECWRHLFGAVFPCQVLVYAPRKGPAGNDEGIELQITFEAELMHQLIHDPEWSRYFEFRGVDASDEGLSPPKWVGSKL